MKKLQHQLDCNKIKMPEFKTQELLLRIFKFIIVEWGQTINVIEGEPLSFKLKRLSEGKTISSWN